MHQFRNSVNNSLLFNFCTEDGLLFIFHKIKQLEENNLTAIRCKRLIFALRIVFLFFVHEKPLQI
jgi:hypothetical protein